MLGVLAWLAGGGWVGSGDGAACFHANMHTSEPGRCMQSLKAWWETGMPAREICTVWLGKFAQLGMRCGPTSAVSALLPSGRGEAEEWGMGGEERGGGREVV